MKRKCEFRQMGYSETGRKAYGCTKHEVVCNSRYRCQEILIQRIKEDEQT